MIKFKADTSKGPLFGFGLSRTNIARLMAGEHIEIDMAELGIKGFTMIFYGEDEATIEAAFKSAGFITKDTEVRVEGKG